jgi:hypothetical protein
MNKPLAAVLVTAVLLGSAVPSQATMVIMKKAKEGGYPAANCLYCHNEKLPVKGKAVSHNERGTFLVKQKEAKKAKEVDVAWLKEFVETKK